MKQLGHAIADTININGHKFGFKDWMMDRRLRMLPGIYLGSKNVQHKNAVFILNFQHYCLFFVVVNTYFFQVSTITRLAS